MKKKIFTLVVSGIMITLSASSQTIKENIDKLAKDKSTRDKADKADVIIMKKEIADSAQIKTTPVKVVTKTAAIKKVKSKKHKYKKKSTSSSK